MASAVEQLVNGNTSDLPVSFNDYYNAYFKDKMGDYGSRYEHSPDSLEGHLLNFFYGHATSAKQAYENYMSDFEYKKNLAAKEAENRATWAREDSQVQRVLKDIKDAGLNPYLALNGGSLNSAMVASQSASARYKTREQQLKTNQDGSKLLNSAFKVLLLAAAMLA